MSDDSKIVLTIRDTPLARIIGPEDPWSLRRLRFVAENWSLAKDSLIAARSYEEGVHFCASALLASVMYQNELTEKEFERIQHVSAYSLLIMLDKSDRWDDYIVWFDYLRRKHNRYLRYDLRFTRNEAREGYILTKGEQYAQIHVLYTYDHRRKVIERKIQKRAEGRSVGGLRHHPKAELSPDEVRRRLENVFGFHRMKQAAQEFWQNYWKR